MTQSVQWRDFPRAFWVSNLIEMCERLSYYGLRTVLPIYLLLAIEKGGPEFNNIQKGEMYAIWAAIQSFVPIFSGGYADRFGYRRTIFASVLFNIAGFLTMAYAVDFGSWLSGGESATTPGHPAVLGFFTLGACLLAFGTAIFKPGIQGLIANLIPAGGSALAWAIFYQVVNVGGFLGPFLAGWMRILTWRYVFFACAAVAALNLIWLIFIQEPARAPSKVSLKELILVACRGIGGIFEPRLFAFLVLFSGYWAMFYQLYDLLPNFIDDWVDSSGIYSTIAQPLFGLVGSTPPTAWDGHIPQEMMININAFMIMLFVSILGAMAGRYSSMTNMAVGIGISAAGVLALQTQNGWMILLGIAVFSVGEMLASPTKMRYMTDIAPPDKRGLYLGYVNATVGIGWTIGSWIAGPLYESTGDKIQLARQWLISKGGMSADAAASLEKTKVLSVLSEKMGQTPEIVTKALWDAHDPSQVWRTFTLIGLSSLIGMFAFDFITKRKMSYESWLFVVMVGIYGALAYGWSYGILFALLLGGRELLLHRLKPTAERMWLPGFYVALVTGIALLTRRFFF